MYQFTLSKLHIAFAGLFVSAFVFSSLEAQDHWTRFRGPNGSGLAEQANLPTKISKADYCWKVELAGKGTSSPVVWGDKLFVMSCDKASAELTLQCLSTKTGDELWAKSFQSSVYRVHSASISPTSASFSPARSTPTLRHITERIDERTSARSISPWLEMGMSLMICTGAFGAE